MPPLASFPINAGFPPELRDAQIDLPEIDAVNAPEEKNLASDGRDKDLFGQDPSFEWVFKADSLQKTAVRSPDYYAQENLLTSEECARMVAMSDSQHVQKSEVYWGIDESEARNTDLFWVPPSDGCFDIFEKILDYVAAVNAEMFSFDLHGYTRPMQLARYRAGQGYDWHQDIGRLSASKRKLSMIIQLSEPHDYDGGDVQFFRNDKEQATAPNSLGSVTIFPSWMVHRVQRISRGERWSLVSWFEGPPFR